jgi:hypothetical protein
MGNPMKHFMQYHNSEKMGYSGDRVAELHILTDKSVTDLRGNTVWLISGEGHRPKSYFLCSVFIASEIGAHDEGNFCYYAQGSRGRFFRPPVRIDHYPWFDAFRGRHGNFAFGLQQLTQGEVEDLHRAAGYALTGLW